MQVKFVATRLIYVSSVAVCNLSGRQTFLLLRCLLEYCIGISRSRIHQIAVAGVAVDFSEAKNRKWFALVNDRRAYALNIDE